jgi:hypothetical protein
LVFGCFVLIPVGGINRKGELLWRSVLSDYYGFTLHRISWERSLESLLLCFIEEFGT